MEGAVADGVITETERTILRKLQESLGVEPEEAARIEADVLAVLTPEPEVQEAPAA